MASKNQVTLTFAGDDKQLQRTFDSVGGGAKKMGDEVGQAAKGFDRASEAADVAENRAQGLASTLTGTADVAKGFGQVAKGDVYGGLVTLGGGAADLAEGFNYTVIPAMKSAVTWLGRTKVGTLAAAGAQHVAAAASKVWAAGQWLLNAALTANPIGLIIAAVVILIGIIVLIATKTTWFQTIWRVAWTGIKAGAVAVWNWLKDLPTKIGNTFRSVAEFIGRPFRAAFNMVANAWNNTIGKLRWSIPSWVPGIGGNTIAAPTLPTFKFHAGGVVPGAPGSEVMALLQAGERVSPAGSSGGAVQLVGAGSGLDRLFLAYLQELMRRNRLKLVAA